MTLGELMDRYRSGLACETPAVRRSWEEMFTFTLRHYTRETPIVTFDPDFLSQRLILAGIHHLIVAGYVKRWRHMLSVAYQHN